MFLLDAFRFCFPSYFPPRDSEVVDVEGGMEQTGEEGKNHVCCWPLLLLAEHAHNLPIYTVSELVGSLFHRHGGGGGSWNKDRDTRGPGGGASHQPPYQPPPNPAVSEAMW